MSNPTTKKKKGAVHAAASEIAKTLNEPMIVLVNRVVRHLGIEQAQTLLQQTLEIEARGGMMTLDGQKRRTPGGVFFRLVKEHIVATDKSLDALIFRVSKRKKKTSSSQSQAKAKQQAKPYIEPIAWPQALQYAHALLKHEKGKARSVEVKLIGRPAKVAKTQSCMVAMLEGQGAPKSLPKGIPAPPEQNQSFAVFISNKHWTKASDALKANPNAELLVRGHPVFNPDKAMTMVLAQSVEVIERKPKKPKEQAA